MDSETHAAKAAFFLSVGTERHTVKRAATYIPSASPLLQRSVMCMMPLILCSALCCDSSLIAAFFKAFSFFRRSADMNSRCAADESLDGTDHWTPKRVVRLAIEPVSTNVSDCISFHPTARLHFAAGQRPVHDVVREFDHCSGLLSFPGYSTAVLSFRWRLLSPIAPRWISSSAGANGRSRSHCRQSMPMMVAISKQNGEEKVHQRGGGGQPRTSSEQRHRDPKRPSTIAPRWISSSAGAKWW